MCEHTVATSFHDKNNMIIMYLYMMCNQSKLSPLVGVQTYVAYQPNWRHQLQAC